jgi:hypothetical protein
MRIVVFPVVVALAACGGDHHANPDAPAPDAPFMVVPHPAAPQIVKMSGSVLTAPKVVPIFFQNDATMQATIEDFAGQLGASPYWSTATAEYGVGAIGVLPTIVTTDAVPTTDTALDTWLAHHFNGQNGWPAAPDPQSIYSVFLPDGAVLQTSGGNSCDTFAAYHDETTAPGNAPVAYALLPRCHYTDPVDDLTESASHEWIEASTDPRVETLPAYGDVDNDDYIWAYVPGGEVSDFCEYVDTANQRLVGPYMVQRSWSNAAAMAGHDPCVPAPNLPYQAAAPVFTEQVSLDSFYNGTIMTKGLQLGVGMSKTIDIALFTDAPAPDFLVGATDVNAFLGGPADLTFAWDRQNGNNGDTLHLTITRQSAGTNNAGSEFVIGVKNGQNNTSLWWGFAHN